MRVRRHRRGNAVLEAALVLPILLLLAMGTVEFGYFFYVKHNLQGAAREGARRAIVANATNADVNAAVASAMQLYGLENSGYTVTANPSDISGAASGDAVSVTVQCTWGTVGIRPLHLIGADKIVKGAAAMRKEN